MTIEELKQLVIQQRAKFTEIAARKDAAIAALDATPEKAEVVRLSDELRQQLSVVEAEESALRNLALERFTSNGDKNPLPGVSIKIFKTYRYDPLVARNWAATASPAMLVLDAKLFEKLAPDMPGAPIEVVNNPKVMLATKLE